MCTAIITNARLSYQNSAAILSSNFSRNFLEIILIFISSHEAHRFLTSLIQKKHIMHKILFLLWTVFLILIPFRLAAQSSEMIFAADNIVLEGNLLKASGNVKIESANIFITAESVSINSKTKEMNFGEIYQFNYGDNTKFQSKTAKFNRDFSAGVISAAKVLLDEAIQIHAQEVQISNGGIESAQRISRVTSCEKCEGKELKWNLTASSAKRDIENSNIVYKNVTVRLKGLPVAYIPYLRMPDPSVERARGFLVPEATITSNLGTGLKLPYFLPMGSSRDILVTPYFSAQTNTIEYRYRQKFHNGDLLLKGAFSNDDLKDRQFRYFVQGKGSFQLKYGINLNLDAGKVGDFSYLGDYGYSDESDLNTKISLEKAVVQRQQFFEGTLSYLNERGQGNSLDEYYSLSGSYVRNIFQKKIPGNLKIEAQLNSALNVNKDYGLSRPPSSAQFSINYNRINLIGPLRFSNSVFADLNSFVNSADAGNMDEEFSLKYGYSTLFSTPFKSSGKDWFNVLTPNISLAFNGQNNDIVGDFFIGSDELSWGNIYSSKKITSLTESEKNVSFSVGLENRTFWTAGNRIELSLAASKIGGLSYTPSVSDKWENGKLNYISKLFYRSKRANTISVTSLFSSKGVVLKNHLKSSISYKKINLKGNYEIIDQSFDKRLSEDLKTLSFSTEYNFLDNFYANVDGRYDVSHARFARTSFGLGLSSGPWEYIFNQEYLKEEREKYSLSAIYNDECTKLIFSFENRFQEQGSSKSVKSLTFRIQLKPFASVVFSQGSDQITF